jgi:hypothetical protein
MGIITGLLVDYLFFAGKPLVVTIACFIAFPIWLFSFFHTGYLLTQKQCLEVLEDRIKLYRKGSTEEIPYDQLESISLEESNKLIVLSMSSKGRTRSYHLYYKWYLRDLMDQSFLKQNFEKFISMIDNVKGLEGKVLIDSSLFSKAGNEVA